MQKIAEDEEMTSEEDIVALQWIAENDQFEPIETAFPKFAEQG